MATLSFIIAFPIFTAVDIQAAPGRYPAGWQPPECILKNAGCDPKTRRRTWVSPGPELFADFVARVAGEAGAGPHVAQVAAVDLDRNIARRGAPPLTVRAALEDAGYTLEVAE